MTVVYNPENGTGSSDVHGIGLADQNTNHPADAAVQQFAYISEVFPSAAPPDALKSGH